MDAVPLTVIRAELVPERPWNHSEPAVTLRGALGAAVVHLACVQEQVRCTSCPHRGDCLVPTWYDPGLGAASGTRPFWLRTVAPTGAAIGPERPLVLIWTFAGALPRPDLVLDALHHAAATGLGADRVRHEVRVTWRDRDGWREGPPEPVPLGALVEAPSPEAPLTLRTVTRLRIRRDGRPVREPWLSDVIETAVLRVRALERQLGRPIPHTWPAPDPGGQPVWCRWESGSRYSARQGRGVDLSGVRAAWAIGVGEAVPWRDVLAAAEWLQLGTATSAGLGVVRLSPPPLPGRGP